MKEFRMYMVLHLMASLLKAHISEMFLQVDGAKIKAKIDCLM